VILGFYTVLYWVLTAGYWRWTQKACGVLSLRTVWLNKWWVHEAAGISASQFLSVLWLVGKATRTASGLYKPWARFTNDLRTNLRHILWPIHRTLIRHTIYPKPLSSLWRYSIIRSGSGFTMNIGSDSLGKSNDLGVSSLGSDSLWILIRIRSWNSP